MFYTNSIVFVDFIFNMQYLSEQSYAYHLMFSMIPYRIGKLCMSLFFIFRLHFVFKETAMKMNKWILIILVTLTIIATCLGCASGIAGPFKLIPYNPIEDDHVHPALIISCTALAIIIFVDGVVMIYYLQRLVAVLILQGEVSYISTGILRKRDRIPSHSISKPDKTKMNDETRDYQQMKILQMLMNLEMKKGK